ncbi:MAG TPA: sugar phosphate isomerase/epimerase [Anaerolineae bacterium]|nr:sugar phosphate isomerase/epimerase [Anaerolineae bacterium]HPL28366.1 sugar phosphate isomerase/epimerase [Anaerolineae bacterium]
MKIGVFDSLFSQLPLEDMLELLVDAGLDAVEIGTGNYPGASHIDVDALLADKQARDAYLAEFTSRGLIISAFSVHGNPIHPNRDMAERHDEAYRKTVRLAHEMGIPIVCVFSGCPGGGPEDRQPNWVTCPWPPEFSNTLNWQWQEVVIPYWQEAGAFAQQHGVRLAFEMHPGFVVYNPETLTRLRGAVGTVVGANFDPSHLFWQGIDPVAAIKSLEHSIYHVHAKDTAIDVQNVAVNGVLDTKPYRDIIHRSWVFRTVGYGHSLIEWRRIVSALRLVGYDYVLSIEHEDALASVGEGFSKAVAMLRESVLAETPAQPWWV